MSACFVALPPWCSVEAVVILDERNRTLLYFVMLGVAGSVALASDVKVQDRARQTVVLLQSTDGRARIAGLASSPFFFCQSNPANSACRIGDS